jgi:hypothetical protein
MSKNSDAGIGRPKILMRSLKTVSVSKETKKIYQEDTTTKLGRWLLGMVDLGNRPEVFSLSVGCGLSAAAERVHSAVPERECDAESS